MTEIQNTQTLRSAFLRIGWAPLITIIGVIIVSVLGICLTLNSEKITGADDALSAMKVSIILSSIVSLAGYFISYKGFAELHREFGITPAGVAVSTLKTIFVIYMIFGGVLLLGAIFIPSSANAYGTMAHNISSSKAGASFGIAYTLFSLIQAIFSIVALFLIRSKTQELADNTNIASLQGAATGAQWGVYVFFMAIAYVFLAALLHSAPIQGILGLVILGFSIYALVRWVGGWLGAAGEVLRHPVEITTFND